MRVVHRGAVCGRLLRTNKLLYTLEARRWESAPLEGGLKGSQGAQGQHRGRKGSTSCASCEYVVSLREKRGLKRHAYRLACNTEGVCCTYKV